MSYILENISMKSNRIFSLQLFILQIPKRKGSFYVIKCKALVEIISISLFSIDYQIYVNDSHNIQYECNLIKSYQ